MHILHSVCAIVWSWSKLFWRKYNLFWGTVRVQSQILYLQYSTSEIRCKKFLLSRKEKIQNNLATTLVVCEEMHGFFTERECMDTDHRLLLHLVKLSAYVIGRHHYHIMFSDWLQLCIPRKPQQYEPYIATVTKVGLVEIHFYIWRLKKNVLTYFQFEPVC